MSGAEKTVALTIAGSDPGGGAGLQADLRTMTCLGVFGLSVVTAITAQNTEGVRETFPIPADQVRSQLQAVLNDMKPVVTKTGMLATAQIIREVALHAAAGRLGKLIVDPVLMSTSGHILGEEHLERELVHSLLPVCDLVTPNVEEATALTGVEIRTLADVKEAALAMTEMGESAICITGGHLRGDPVDILFDGSDFTEFRGKRLGGPEARFHGTGCLFSAAVAGYLALGLDLREAIASAKILVERAIRDAISPGNGMAIPWLDCSISRLEPGTHNH